MKVFIAFISFLAGGVRRCTVWILAFYFIPIMKKNTRQETMRIFLGLSRYLFACNYFPIKLFTLILFSDVSSFQINRTGSEYIRYHTIIVKILLYSCSRKNCRNIIYGTVLVPVSVSVSVPVIVRHQY